jgi:hypothetical protein
MENDHRKLILETLETLLELQLNSIRQLLGKFDPQPGAVRKRDRKRMSLIDLCVKILTDERRSVHVDELVEILRERYGRETDRDSLSSALAKKAKRGLLFRRVAPATFEIPE